MRTIVLEEHFASPGFLHGPGHELKAQALKFGALAVRLFDQLCDVGEKRIAEMDAARIDVQVLSLTSPGTEQLEGDDAMVLARESNDFLAEAVKRNPARLEVGIDRIMFSTDHPYASMTDARAFLDRLPVSSADKARVAHGNAERLFGF